MYSRPTVRSCLSVIDCNVSVFSGDVGVGELFLYFICRKVWHDATAFLKALYTFFAVVR